MDLPEVGSLLRDPLETLHCHCEDIPWAVSWLAGQNVVAVLMVEVAEVLQDQVVAELRERLAVAEGENLHQRHAEGVDVAAAGPLPLKS